MLFALFLHLDIYNLHPTLISQSSKPKVLLLVDKKTTELTKHNK